MNEALDAAMQDPVVRATAWALRPGYPEGRAFDLAWSALCALQAWRFRVVLARHGVSGS